MSNQKYSEELKAHILARKYEPCAATIHNWMRQVAEAKFSKSQSTEDDESKIRRLERRNQQLEQENAFLKKAAAWFASDSATETGGTRRTH